MSELQWERLENLVTNPYTWVFFIFLISLGYILQYLRRFYPKNLREKLDKEAACTLELNQKPEMKRLRKIFFISWIFIAAFSYLFAYKILDFSSNNLIDIKAFDTPYEVFITCMLIGIIISGTIMAISEKKVVGYKNCNDVVVGSKIMNFLGYVLGIPMLLFFIVMLLLYPRYYTTFDDRGITYSTLYEWNAHSKKYTDIAKIEFLTKNRCQNLKIVFIDDTIWNLKDYKELQYKGNRDKLAKFVSEKSNIEIQEIVQNEK